MIHIPRYQQIPSLRRFVETTIAAFHPIGTDWPRGSIGSQAKAEVTAACARRRRIDPQWLGHVACAALARDFGRRIPGAAITAPQSIWALACPTINGTIRTAFHCNDTEQAARVDRYLQQLPRRVRELGYCATQITCPLSSLHTIDPRGHIAFNLACFGACIFRGGDLPTAIAQNVFFQVEHDQCTITIPAPLFCEAAYASNPDLYPRKIAYVPGKIPFGDIFRLLIDGSRHLGLTSQCVTIHGEDYEHPLILALHDLMYHMQHLVQVPQHDIEPVANFLGHCLTLCPELAYEMPLWPLLEPVADAYAGRIAPERAPRYQLRFVIEPFIMTAEAYMKKWQISREDRGSVATQLSLLAADLHQRATTWSPPVGWLER